jgi:hypothetical protein
MDLALPNVSFVQKANFDAVDVVVLQFGIQEMSYAIHYNTDADLGTYILVSTSTARLFCLNSFFSIIEPGSHRSRQRPHRRSYGSRSRPRDQRGTRAGGGDEVQAMG